MKFEELSFREYLIYALGADHARDFEKYNEQFIRTFLQPERLNPEDHIGDDNNMVSDSLNS